MNADLLIRVVMLFQTVQARRRSLLQDGGVLALRHRQGFLIGAGRIVAPALPRQDIAAALHQLAEAPLLAVRMHARQGGVQPGHSALREMRCVPAHWKPSRPTPTPYFSALPSPSTR